MKKRLSALFLTLALCLGLAVPAFAASGDNLEELYTSTPDKSGILDEVKTGTYKLRMLQVDTGNYGNEQDLGNTTTALIPKGMDVTITGVKPTDISFIAMTDPNGTGVFYQRLFMSESGKGVSVVSLPEGDAYTDLDSKAQFSVSVTAEQLGFKAAQNGAVTFTADRLYELFDVNTMLWIGINGELAWELMLSGEPTLISSIFTDVHVGQWYTDPVVWARQNDITNGTSEDKFSPGQNCTQAQILTFLYRADRGEGAATADDMEKAISWAREKGMIDDTFDGSKPCTRSTAVSYIWQAFEKPTAKASNFTDVDTNADYAGAVSWAVEKKVTQGTSETTFSPDEICTRGHIVTFLYRAYNN